jgi:hypothetical protein
MSEHRRPHECRHHDGFKSHLRSPLKKAQRLNVLAVQLDTVPALGIASAQLPMPSIDLNADRPETPDEKAKQKAIDDEYKSTVRKIPDKQKPSDPWANIRPTTTTPSKRRQQ